MTVNGIAAVVGWKMMMLVVFEMSKVAQKPMRWLPQPPYRYWELQPL
jgi:hypothetical protein